MIAFITEDESDSEVLGALVERLVGVQLVRVPYLAQRGFGAVLTTAARLVPHAARAGARFIVVVVDCDATPDHYSEPLPHSGCRLCRLHEELPTAQEIDRLSGKRSRLVAALTVRTIETWLAVAGSLSVPGSIAEFGKMPEERRRLKEIVYGDPSPSTPRMIERGVELIHQADLGVMEATLKSFAAFAKLVRA